MDTTDIVSIIAALIGFAAGGLASWAVFIRLQKERLRSESILVEVTSSLSQAAKSTSDAAQALEGLAKTTPAAADALLRTADQNIEVAKSMSRSIDFLQARKGGEGRAEFPERIAYLAPFEPEAIDLGQATKYNHYLTSDEGRSELHNFLFSEWELRASILDFEEALFKEGESNEDSLIKLGIEPTEENISSLKKLYKWGKEALTGVGKKTFETLNNFLKNGAKNLVGQGDADDGGD